MIWAGISAVEHTDLYFIENASLVAQRYLLEILQPTVLPYIVAVEEEFIFMDHNAHPHRVNIVNNWLEEIGIEKMNWPVNSPDANPIEHDGDALRRRIAARNIPSRTLSDLRIALEMPNKFAIF